MIATLFELPAPVTVKRVKVKPSEIVYVDLPPAPTGQALMDTLTDLTIMDIRSVVAVRAATVDELRTALSLLPADNIGRRGVLEYAIKKRGGALGLQVTA